MTHNNPYNQIEYLGKQEEQEVNLNNNYNQVNQNPNPPK